MSLVSVIIPVYNLEKYIKECLLSFLSQSFKDFELIFVDDASSDNTAEIIKSFTDERIKLFEIEKSNAGCARNYGLKVACGKWVVFFDGDDFCSEFFLEKMVQKAEKTDADVVICASAEYFEKNGKISRHRYSHTLKWVDEGLENFTGSLVQAKNNQILELMEPWNKIYSRKFLLSNDIKFQEITNSNDTLFSHNVLLKAEKIAFLKDELVYTRRGRKSSLSFSANKNWKNYFLAYNEADKLVFNYKYFDDIKEAYFDRKFRAYKYFYKKTGVLNKLPYLFMFINEMKTANNILNKEKYTLFKILF